MHTKTNTMLWTLNTVSKCNVLHTCTLLDTLGSVTGYPHPITPYPTTHTWRNQYSMIHEYWCMVCFCFVRSRQRVPIARMHGVRGAVLPSQAGKPTSRILPRASAPCALHTPIDLGIHVVCTSFMHIVCALNAHCVSTLFVHYFCVCILFIFDVGRWQGV